MRVVRMLGTHLIQSRKYLLIWRLSWPLHRIELSTQEHGSQLNSLIVEPRNPDNHNPAFHAGVAVHANAISTTSASDGVDR